MDEELRKKIITDIKKTGFPSELKVASVLRKNNWTVEQNGTYVDYETNRSREIDIKSYKLFKQKKSNFYFFLHLIIEVKKSERPWVFFTSKNEKEPIFGFKGPGYLQIHVADNFDSKILSAYEMGKNFPRNNEDTIGINYYEAFKSPNEPSKIYEALLSSIKAAYHKVKESENHWETNTKKFDPNERIELDIYMPVVIIDGMVCKAALSDDESVTVEKSDYVPLEISHSTKPYDDHISYYPEVMTLDYLESFLQKITTWGESITEITENNLNKLKSSK